MQTNGKSPSLDEMRERKAILQEAMELQALEHKFNALESLHASFAGGWGSFVNPYEYLPDMEFGGQYNNYFFSRVDSRAHGRDAPLYRNEMELGQIRHQSRNLCRTNNAAKGLLRNLVNYVVGKGYPCNVVPLPRFQDVDSEKPGAQIPERVQQVADMVQRWIDDFFARNKFRLKQREIYRRIKRDGECFLRLFCNEETGKTTLRWVEPEQIINPPGGTEANGWSFGIRHQVEPVEDVETVIAYYVAYKEDAANGVVVEAKDMLHVKNFDEDSTVKRGLPEFSFETYESLRRAGVLQRNMSITAASQAAVAEITQFENASKSQVEEFNRSQQALTAQNPYNGRTEQIDVERPGQKRQIPKGQSYVEPPFSQSIPLHLQVEQADLRTAAAAVSAPEYFTGNSDGSNFAAIRETSAPFLKNADSEQDYLSEALKQLLTDVVRRGIEYGKLPQDTFHLVELQIEPAVIVQRDPLQRTQELTTQVQARLTSPQTAMLELGRDPDKEKANWQEWDESNGGDMAGLADLFGGVPGGDGQGEGSQWGGDSMPFTESRKRKRKRRGKKPVLESDFDENKHKRADDGKFTSGGGSSGSKDDNGKTDSSSQSKPPEHIQAAEVKAEQAGDWAREADNRVETFFTENPVISLSSDELSEMSADDLTAIISSAKDDLARNIAKMRQELVDLIGDDDDKAHKSVLKDIDKVAEDTLVTIDKEGAKLQELHAKAAELKAEWERLEEQEPPIEYNDEHPEWVEPPTEPQEPPYHNIEEPIEPDRDDYDSQEQFDADYKQWEADQKTYDQAEADYEKAYDEYDKKFDKHLDEMSKWEKQNDKKAKQVDREWGQWERQKNKAEDAYDRAFAKADDQHGKMIDKLNDSQDWLGTTFEGHAEYIHSENQDAVDDWHLNYSSDEETKATESRRILESGFTGTKVDKLGRKITYQDGKRVSGNKSSTPNAGGRKVQLYSGQVAMQGDKFSRQTARELTDHAKSKLAGEKPIVTPSETGKEFYGYLDGMIKKAFKTFENDLVDNFGDQVLDDIGAELEDFAYELSIHLENAKSAVMNAAKTIEQSGDSKKMKKAITKAQDAMSSSSSHMADIFNRHQRMIVDSIVGSKESIQYMESGFTGTKTDSLGRKVKYVDGKRVAGDGSDTTAATKSRMPMKAKAWKAAKNIIAIANAAPAFAKETMLKAGFSPKVATAAYIVATVGDYAVPGLPAASAVITIMATIRKPAAPLQVVRELVAKFKSKKTTESVDRNLMMAAGELLHNAANYEWAMTVLAVAIEDEGQLTQAAIDTTVAILDEQPEPETESVHQVTEADLVDDNAQD